MSKNRDKKLDIENTKRILNNLPVVTKGSRNWLGHIDGGAIIDEMLIKGATLQELQKTLEKIRTEKSIKNHFRHLENYHGLSIADHKIEGVYRFDYSTETNKHKTQQLKKSYDKKIKKLTDTERKSIVSQRIGQDTLRKLLLNEYENKCAMCDVDAVEVLRASHIVPWSKDKKIRLELSNAILLCGLHDLAFDKGLITINDDFSISLPKKPKGLTNVLEKCTYEKLNLPKSKESHPNPEYLLRHKKLN